MTAVKTKRKQLAAIADEGSPVSQVKPAKPASPFSDPPCDLDDSWVEVRKQRVIIIIPPPKSQQEPRITGKAHAKRLKTGCRKSASKAAKVVAKKHSDSASRNLKKSFSSCDHGEQAKSRTSSMPRADEGQDRNKRKWASLLSQDNKRRRSAGEDLPAGNPPLSSMDILLASVDTVNAQEATARGGVDGSHQQRIVAVSGKNQQKENAVKRRTSHDVPLPSNSGRNKGKVVGSKRFSNTNGAIPAYNKQTVANVRGLSFIQREKTHNLGSLDGRKTAFSNSPPVLSAHQAFKVLTLRRQLKKAGGLSNWLFSIGLGQFIEAFQDRVFSEVELLQLSMEDLKKMGKLAVGPRRKFVWGINHLSKQLV